MMVQGAVVLFAAASSRMLVVTLTLIMLIG